MTAMWAKTEKPPRRGNTMENLYARMTCCKMCTRAWNVAAETRCSLGKLEVALVSSQQIFPRKGKIKISGESKFLLHNPSLSDLKQILAPKAVKVFQNWSPESSQASSHNASSAKLCQAQWSRPRTQSSDEQQCASQKLHQSWLVKAATEQIKAIVDLPLRGLVVASC